MLKTIGQTIRGLRKEKNLTQEELAEAINVTPQAISKWENNVGLPDISQIIPLATFFGVSSDVILGISENHRNEEIKQIIKESKNLSKERCNIKSWLLIQDALKKYPTNLELLQESIELGISLAYKENYTYNEEYAEKIYKETIKQTDLIIKYSRNITNVLRAHMIMVLLHSSFGDAESAVKHANEFPWRTDMNSHSMCAYINHSFKLYDIEKVNLQRSFFQILIASIDTLSLLGQSYENTQNYEEALEMYLTILSIIKYVFNKDDYFPPLYKVENGNIYCFIARTYIKMGNEIDSLKWLEKMVIEEIELKKVEKQEFIIKNNYLNKSNWFNFVNYRINNEDCDVKHCLCLPCFNELKENNKYQELIELAKQLN